MKHIADFLVILALFVSSACVSSPEQAKAPVSSNKTITLLFTNDIESAYDPTEAFWLEDLDYIGGVAELSTLIRQYRQSEPNAFLFDSGDIFTGALAKLTRGQLSFELMISMDYDAMAIGNHEFEYGEQILAWEKNRVPFPVLGANLFYTGTRQPFAQPHAVIERNGVRIGVVGAMGQDAATAIIPSYIDDLFVEDLQQAVQRSVDELRDEVDLIVVLTHQGKTAPMQTDAESDPRLFRGIDADIALAGAVKGIDVIFGGHSDAGTPDPFVHPETGTIIMQTYGQATHLGYLQLDYDTDSNQITSHRGELIPVASSALTPDPIVRDKIQAYRDAYPALQEVVGQTEQILFRRYIEESALGHLIADIFRETADADIGLIHSGGIRKDIPAGAIRREDVLDTYPFVDNLIKVELSGRQLRAAIEQSLTLERGLLQVSGLSIEYDLERPEGDRAVSIRLDDVDLSDDMRLSVAVAGFLAEGGDRCFRKAKSSEISAKSPTRFWSTSELLGQSHSRAWGARCQLSRL
ncbi:MAG: bifunctional UDP-sugar hydrolase/5'-nucleotidase [Pseudomonadota bacterium]